MPLGGVTVIVPGAAGRGRDAHQRQGRVQLQQPARRHVRHPLLRGELVDPGRAGRASSSPPTRWCASTPRSPARRQTPPRRPTSSRARRPTIDIGSARVGAQFDEEFITNVPLGRTYGDVIERAPGAFVDPSGNVSIGGATGLENIYIVNGLNVTGVEYGNLESGTAVASAAAPTSRSSS